MQIHKFKDYNIYFKTIYAEDIMRGRGLDMWIPIVLILRDNRVDDAHNMYNCPIQKEIINLTNGNERISCEGTHIIMLWTIVIH